MTRYNRKEREQLANDIKGQTIKALEYDVEDDYYTITLGNDVEFSFRFMADLVRAKTE